jgi:UDP-glucuronate decarboxylase
MIKEKNNTILITGGAGFIGSHLCDRLINSENHIVCLDNFYTGSRNNISHHLNKSNFEVIRHNIWQPIYIEADQVFNLACAASPVHYQNDPIGTIKTTVLGAMNMLGLAKRCSARILQASTSEVYGDPKVHPQVESYVGSVNPIGIRACYDEGKRCSETLFFDYYRQHSIDIRVVRIFNTYGPRMQINDGRVVSNFIVQALRNQPITIYGNGTQTRSFCYVDDLIDGLISMMGQNVEVGPVNLGNPSEFTILELAEMVLRLTDSKSELVFRPLPQDDPIQRKPDITKAQDSLDWKPKVGLEDGLKQTISYFRKTLNS